MKKRRAPYAKLPQEIAEHGYVTDLVDAVQRAAESLGRTVTVHQKNGDYYLAVLVPSREELAEIDAQSAADAGREGGQA